MKRQELEHYLADFLSVSEIKDYCPNGLQVEGVETINKVVTGVTASKALIDQAIALNADAILVHHGYFWKGEEQTITGVKFNRIKALIEHGINLFAYHLPIDVHPELGNNVMLAKRFGIENVRPVGFVKPVGVVMQGELPTAVSTTLFAQTIESSLARKPLYLADKSDKAIKRLAWCTGGGQSYIEAGASIGADAFISGEASEQTTHLAQELDIHYFGAGHHATERYGIKALGEHLTEKFGLDVEFADLPNPV